MIRSLPRAGVTGDQVADAIRARRSPGQRKDHDFIIDRRHDKAAVARRMGVTGR
jgi:hypothetical protein